MPTVEEVFALLSEDQKKLVLDFDVRFRSADKNIGYVHAIGELIALAERAVGEGRVIDKKVRKQIMRAVDGLRSEVIAEFVWLRKGLKIDEEIMAVFGEHVREHVEHMRSVELHAVEELSLVQREKIISAARSVEDALKKQAEIVVWERDVLQGEIDAIARLCQEVEKEYPNKEVLRDISAILSDKSYKLKAWLIAEKKVCVDQLGVLLKSYPSILSGLSEWRVSSVEFRELLDRVTRRDELAELLGAIQKDPKRFPSDALGEVKKLIEKQRVAKGFFNVFSEVVGRLVGLRDVVGGLKKKADVDELTGLLRKERFFEVLNGLVQAGRDRDVMFCLAMIDADNFKKVNDTYGHLVGDAVLRGLGEVVSGAIRKGDYAFRYGGEELAVIFSRADLSVAVDICERIRKAVEERVFVGDERGKKVNFVVSVSIGVVEFSKGKSGEELIKYADRLMYEAKRQGKNRVVAQQVESLENQQV